MQNYTPMTEVYGHYNFAKHDLSRETPVGFLAKSRLTDLDLFKDADRVFRSVEFMSDATLYVNSELQSYILSGDIANSRYELGKVAYDKCSRVEDLMYIHTQLNSLDMLGVGSMLYTEKLQDERAKRSIIVGWDKWETDARHACLCLLDSRHDYHALNLGEHDLYMVDKMEEHGDDFKLRYNFDNRVKTSLHDSFVLIRDKTVAKLQLDKLAEEALEELANAE